MRSRVLTIVRRNLLSLRMDPGNRPRVRSSRLPRERGEVVAEAVVRGEYLFRSATTLTVEDTEELAVAFGHLPADTPETLLVRSFRR